MLKTEKLGISLSVVCAIHCITLPFLITFFPLLGIDWFHESIEFVLLGGSFLLAMWILGTDYKKHKIVEPLIWACLGFVFIATGHILEQSETIFSFLGGISLLIAYWRNMKVKHQIKACEC
ncbi:MAG: MerC domain-containing protein [Bacteroidetes bacterium]|nr:MAG: MerC domain-containing protein [Bacteroidota bacterium]